MDKQRFQLIAAVFILLIKDNKILLNKRHNTKWEDGKWSLIGGHIDGGETAVEAVIREAEEEISLQVDKKDVEFCNVAHLITNSERIHFSFVVKKWQGIIRNNSPEEMSEVSWFPLDTLPANLSEISRKTVEWYKEKKVYTEFGWEKNE